MRQDTEGPQKAAMTRRCETWCKRAKNEQAGGPAKIKIEKRLEEIAKIERESIAVALAARPSVPINKWFSLQVLPNDLIGWETKNCHFSYVKGRIQLRQGEMFYPIIAKDSSIRVKVSCRSDNYVRLLLRCSSQGCYSARVAGGKLAIIKQKWQAIGDRLFTKSEDVLATISLPRKRSDLFFEFAFSSVADVLVAYVNRQPLLQANDAEFSEGSVGLGTFQSDGLYFSDVAMMIPGKASFVADRRLPADNKPTSPKKP
jgi:hypothetical protein